MLRHGKYFHVIRVLWHGSTGNTPTRLLYQVLFIITTPLTDFQVNSLHMVMIVGILGCYAIGLPAVRFSLAFIGPFIAALLLSKMIYQTKFIPDYRTTVNCSVSSFEFGKPGVPRVVLTQPLYNIIECSNDCFNWILLRVLRP